MLKPLSTSSFTRFLIPLADVMTLLFSLFLLLPHVQQQPGEESANAASPGQRWTPEEQRQADEELTRLRRFMQIPAEEREYTVRLELDGETGDLLLLKGTRRIRLSDQDIRMVVREHEEEARRADKELVYYVIVTPRSASSSRPGVDDIKKHLEWFGKHRVKYL